MSRLLILFIALFLFIPMVNSQDLFGYKNLKWNTPLNSNFLNCVPTELYSLKQNILACQYQYDDKTYGYIKNAYVSYIFYDKKLIAVRIGIFNEVLDSQIITNKYGKPKIDWGQVKTWDIGESSIEYSCKGETRNKLTKELISPMFTSITYMFKTKYNEITKLRKEAIYNNI